MASQSSNATDQAWRRFCTFLAFFLFLSGATALIVWLIYHPQKPQFSVAGAAVYELNAASPPFITSSIQFTVISKNPNKKVSIYYDKLSSYITYRNQVITSPVILPPMYHRSESTVMVSPVMGSAGVPVPAEVANGLVMDEAFGVVALQVVVVGRLRWKAGAIKTERYGFSVKCDVWLGLKRGFVGQVPLLKSSACKVDV